MGGNMSQPAHRAMADRDELDDPYRSADPSIRRPRQLPRVAAAAPVPIQNDDNNPPPLPFLSFRQSLLASFSPALSANLSASGGSLSPFPRLTMHQLAQLRDNGVDMDLCFVPHQMPRLTAHHLDEEGKEREKRCVTIDNCMAVAQPALTSTLTSATSASSSSATTPSSPPVPAQSVDNLSLSFTVDSSVPCCVSVYPAATEVIDRSVSDQPPAFTPHSQCHLWTQTLPAGLQQTLSVPLLSLFPLGVLDRAMAARDSSPPSLSSSAFPSLFAFSSSRHYFPLIIHCENLSYQSPSSNLLPSSAQHKRRDEQKERVAIDIDTPPTVDHLIVYLLFTKHTNTTNSTTELAQPVVAPTSSPAPSPTASGRAVRSATAVPAAVTPLPSGPAVLGVKRLKQKIKLLHNKSYELSDLYGLNDRPESIASPMQPAASPQQPAAGQESVELATCCICLTNRRTHAIFPCRHVCLCASCAVQLREQTNRCPICRRMVETVIPILTDPDAVGDDVAAGRDEGEVAVGGREWYERH